MLESELVAAREVALSTDISGGNFNPFFKSLLLGLAALRKIRDMDTCWPTVWNSPSPQRGCYLSAVGLLSEVTPSGLPAHLGGPAAA